MSADYNLLPHSTGLVLNPELESDSEDSEPDGQDDPQIPSPEMDDVKGERVGQDIYLNLFKHEPVIIIRSLCTE